MTSLSRFMDINGYYELLSLKDTQRAIKLLKDYFEGELARELNLQRVSAPLFVKESSGLNDNLNGSERPVAFDIPSMPSESIEIVHSLAKWKRMALGEYGYEAGQGLYTDMNAIRRDEELDNTHSIYVDQWDWELIINKEDRTEETLKEVVMRIYAAFRKTEKMITKIFSQLSTRLPEDIFFVTSQELEDLYPSLSPEDREHEAARKHGAVFVMKIGAELRSGKPHGSRAPDYDDWKLNGDIIFYCPTIRGALEMSSMGIRVDEAALLHQLKEKCCEDRLSLDFHTRLMAGKLPYTIGGGIGQSRLCMYFLQKAHIGQVQASIWDSYTLEECLKHGITLL